MSAYHRLISYIYAYEGGVKGKNTGFVKLETRGASCRIQLSVRRIFAGGSPVGVYLLAGQDEIRIGTLFVRGGNGEFRTTVNSDNIEGSGCRIEECCGLTIHETESAWRAYTTIWEDAVTHAAEVELEDVTAEKVRAREEAREAEQKRLKERAEKAEAGVDNASAGTVEKDAPVGRAVENAPAEIEEDAAKGAVRDLSAETAAWSASAEAAAEDASMEMTVEKVCAETASENHAAETITETPAEVFLGEKKGAAPEKGEVSCQGNEEKKLDSAEKAESDSVKLEDWDDADAWDCVRETAEAAEGSAKKGQEEKAEMPHEEEKVPVSSPDEILWKRLRASYPKVTAFEWTDGCEILVIKPQDIGLLPRENWVYGNNSFLLHGYYNYRYLILARLGKREGPGQYILGVPGHYGKNEKYMASMFGFTHFVRSVRQPPRDSRFGYWYTGLNLT